MRFFSFVFLFVFGMNVWAQSPVVTKLYSDGTRYANTQDFAHALKSYKTALLAAENEYLSDRYRAQVHYNIGVCHFQLQQFDQATNEFKSALLLKKDYVHAHHALGMAKTRLKEWRSVSASLKDSLQADLKNRESTRSGH